MAVFEMNASQELNRAQLLRNICCEFESEAWFRLPPNANAKHILTSHGSFWKERFAEAEQSSSVAKYLLWICDANTCIAFAFAGSTRMNQAWDRIKHWKAHKTCTWAQNTHWTTIHRFLSSDCECDTKTCLRQDTLENITTICTCTLAKQANKLDTQFKKKNSSKF